MLTAPPHGLQEIIEVFGSLDNPRFEQENIVQFALPYPLIYDGKQVLKSRCHKKAVENFQWAFEQLAMAGLQDECREYGGIYASRKVRGAAKPSTHSWGISIDLEPQKYPLGSGKRMPDDVVGIWKAAGFFYGGDFSGRKDPMHLQLCSGY